jgi:cytochrome c553
MTTAPRRRLVAPAALLLALGGVAPTRAADYVDQRMLEPIHADVAAGATKAVVCLACHGPAGNAVVPAFPRLAGQRAEYLYYRLREFRHADTKLPYYAASPMPVQAKTLSDEDMRDLAVYFAAQTPVATPGAIAPADASGETLFREGDAGRGIPPCQGCHGAAADGGPVAAGQQYLLYPALRGQHAPYLVARLRSYRDGWPRYAGGDYIMAGIARTLDDESIQAVAAYLAALPPSH